MRSPRLRARSGIDEGGGPEDEGGVKNEWATTSGTGNRNSAFGLSGSTGHVAALLGCILLMVLCPGFVIYTTLIYRDFDGSAMMFLSWASRQPWSAIQLMWPTPGAQAWRAFAVFGAIAAAFQLFMPGATFHGPISPKGNVPVYKANGVQSWAATVLLFFVSWHYGWWDPAVYYPLLVEVLAVCNIVGLALCVALTVKGFVAPSSSDSGSNGSLVYDFYWGTELYPRIGKYFDIKTWTNCRMGMMSWTVLPLCYAAYQWETFGFLSNSMIACQLIMQAYVFKFFLWETGYWRTMDIAHDRAGYYLCWGCLNWVPAVYTSPAYFLAAHPIQLPTPLFYAITLTGLACVYINWAADEQKKAFREADGKELVWGRPPTIVRAKYGTADGKQKDSLLLASGWWGFSRHFHYLPEVGASLCWTLPAQFGCALPYFYVVYLSILLLDRLFRDDARCKAKYGKDWDRYCDIVSYRLIPYVW